ncbi:MAG TPA: S8 family serine peptidase [Luteimonas sp.]|nr:S8 family serine peptidase [Luteimonas sp.]
MKHPTAGQPARRLARDGLACALLAALAACGGGGGDDNVRPDPPPTAPPPLPPITPPAQPDPPLVQPPNPAYSGHLQQTNAGVAHAAGFTGAGVRIGVVDTGVNRRHPALAGRVLANLSYVDPAENNLAVDDVVGHGTAIAQAAAGQAFGQWPGGMAPGAQIVSARIINDEPPEDDGSGEGNEVDGALGLAGIHADLIARGARIMNNSWGGLYWTDLRATAAIADEYRRFVFNNDGLVVFATGNEGKPNPSDNAALPSKPGPGGTTPAADLERGWLAVAALDRDNPALLADYSNACGVAKDYCLAAPGSVVVTGTTDGPNSPSYYRWQGTSLAAPLVSGAAALVWQAFPYFSNDLVRQTLLGTATDLGAPGIDAVFGNGRLDAGRAIGGPARLDWGTVDVAFDGITSTWSNPLSGNGRVSKSGSGTLVLAADAGNRGGLTVNGGTLRANGAIGGSVAVAAGGRLVFGRDLDGSLVNAGRVDLAAPGNPSGTARVLAHVDGDYLHRDGATLGVQLGSSLVMTGRAVLEGGDLQVTGVRNGYVTQSREELLFAQQRVTGTFDALTASPGVFLDARLAYGDYQVWLDITRLDVSQAAASFQMVTPATLSSALRLEAAFDGIDRAGQGGDGSAPAVSPGFRAMAGDIQRIGAEADASAALASLSGDVHAAAAGATFDAIDMGRRALSSRVGDIAGREAGGAGAWAQALGQGGQGGYAGSSGVATDGWLAGRDQWLGGGGFAGMAFGQTHAWQAETGARSRDRQVQGQLYAGVLRGNGYLLGQGGVGRFDRDIERQLSGGRSTHGVSSRYAGRFHTASVEGGYRVALGAGTLTPYVGAEYTHLGSEGFQELGGEGFGLRTADWSASRTQALAGLQLARRWGDIALQGYGEWQHTVASSGLQVDASFVGIEAWSPLPSLSPSRSGGLFGVALEAWLAPAASLSLGFDQRFGPRGDARLVSLRYARGF